MHGRRTDSGWTRVGTLVATVTVAIGVMMATPPARATSLLASQTSVTGYPFHGQGPGDVHVVLVADVSGPVLATPGTVTPPTVTFTVGLPAAQRGNHRTEHLGCAVDQPLPHAHVLTERPPHPPRPMAQGLGLNEDRCSWAIFHSAPSATRTSVVRARAAMWSPSLSNP